MSYQLDNFGLTLKQRLFCENYLENGGNGTQAAKDAGYSESAAYNQAHENLNKRDVQRYLKVRMKEIFEKVGMTTEFRAKKLMQGLQMAIPDWDSIKNETIELQIEAMKAADIRAGVACIAEANKMDGSYSPDTHAVLLEESTNNVIQDKIEKFEKEF